METNSYPIIGMSPGNSYFKDVEILFLLKETIERYGKTCVFVADVPAIATYRAFGYPENQARNKAIPKGNNLKNRTRRLMTELGYDSSQVRIIDWVEEVADNKEYQQIYESRVKLLYETNIEFSRAIDQTTRAVLESSGKMISDLHAATKIATHYLLSEIAFLEFAPQFLLSHNVTYVYHRNWPIYEDYISGKFDGQIKPYLNFLLLENPYETFNRNNLCHTPEPNSVLNKVVDTNILRVAYDDYFPAFITDLETTEHTGIFAEVLKDIAKHCGWSIQWVEEVGYGVIAYGLSEGRFDIFGSTVWPTLERQGTALFSESLYESSVYAWKAEIDPRNYALASTNPFLRIAVKEGDISHSLATELFPFARLVRVPQLADPVALLLFVAQGKADLTFVEPVLAAYFEKQYSEKVIKVDELGIIRKYPNTFMVAEGQSTLLAEINHAISRMKEEGFIKQLIEKYTGNNKTFE